MSTRRLSPEAKVAIVALHRAAVRKLLRAEATALTLLKAPVEAASARLVATIARAPESATTRRHVIAAVRRESAQLHAEFRPAVRASRDIARGNARGQILLETAPIAAWAWARGSFGPPATTTNPHANELDAFEAERAAASMSVAWASLAVARLAQWERGDGKATTLPRALDVSKAAAPRVERHATVQATTAYADEHRGYWDAALSADNDVAPVWRAGVLQTWSAVLDRRTCPECEGLDGQTVRGNDTFSGGAETPLHNMCRCVVVTTFDGEGIVAANEVRGYFRDQTLNGLMKTQ